MSADLMAAVVERLRATPAVVAALGEDTSSLATTKIWADDLAQGRPSLPYLTYSEPDEGQMAESADAAGVVHYVARGRTTLTLHAAAKLEARSILRLVAAALTDAELSLDDGDLLELRPAGSAARPVPAIGPGSPVVYHRSVDLAYVVLRTFDD